MPLPTANAHIPTMLCTLADPLAHAELWSWSKTSLYLEPTYAGPGTVAPRKPLLTAARGLTTGCQTREATARSTPPTRGRRCPAGILRNSSMLPHPPCLPCCVLTPAVFPRRPPPALLCPHADPCLPCSALLPCDPLWPRRVRSPAASRGLHEGAGGRGVRVQPEACGDATVCCLPSMFSSSPWAVQPHRSVRRTHALSPRPRLLSRKRRLSSSSARRAACSQSTISASRFCTAARTASL